LIATAGNAVKRNGKTGHEASKLTRMSILRSISLEDLHDVTKAFLRS